jgi:Ankyrin repeats (3 copies)
LLCNGANPCFPNKKKEGPIFYAVHLCKKLRKLLGDEDTASSADRDGNGSKRCDSAAILELLLQHGADARCLNHKCDGPVHVAVRHGRADLLAILLQHDPGLVDQVNWRTGYSPLHYAAACLEVECAARLLRCGASVTQLTEVGETGGQRCSVLHLAARTVAANQLPQHYTQNVTKIIVQKSHKERKTDEEKQRTKEILDLFLAELPQDKCAVIDDSQVGSILHYFAAVNYVYGIRMLASAPFNHPPDMPNQSGHTPVMVGILTNSLDAVLQLLDFDIDLTRKCPLPPKLPPMGKKLSSIENQKARGNHRDKKRGQKQGKYRHITFCR